jgi:hypothetical protein
MKALGANKPFKSDLTKEQHMSVRFGEVQKSSGLDVDHKPFPAMIVPLRGSIIIKVFGADGVELVR